MYVRGELVTHCTAVVFLCSVIFPAVGIDDLFFGLTHIMPLPLPGILIVHVTMTYSQ